MAEDRSSTKNTSQFSSGSLRNAVSEVWSLAWPTILTMAGWNSVTQGAQIASQGAQTASDGAHPLTLSLAVVWPT